LHSGQSKNFSFPLVGEDGHTKTIFFLHLYKKMAKLKRFSFFLMREGGRTKTVSLLPLWEKVAEGRMRGAKQTQKANAFSPLPP